MDKIAQALRAVMTEIQAMPEPQQPGAADRKEFALRRESRYIWDMKVFTGAGIKRMQRN